MVTVTDHAIHRLEDKLETQPEGFAVRMKIKNGRVKFRPDTQQEGDVVVSHKGRSVLFMAAEIADKVSKRTLGVVTTEAGQRLRFVPSA